MNSSVEITIGQIIFAAFIGFAGIIAAFAPAIAVSTHYIGKQHQEHGSVSIFTFLVAFIVTQLIVSIFFYNGMKIFDLFVKIDNMKIFGDSGMFALFWNTPVIYSTPMTQTWTTVIVIARQIVQTVNAFMPILITGTGGIIGYWISVNQFQRSDHGQSDYFMVGFYIFASMFVAALVYHAWSGFASYALNMPGSNGITQLSEAAQHWWQVALGIIPKNEK